MPPLPSSLQDETANLIELLDRRLKDLREFQIPRLRDFKGSLRTQQQYAAELREDLDVFARNVQKLETLAEDQERERDRRQVANRAQEFAGSLVSLKKDTRVALLTSKRVVDSMAFSNREELFRTNAMSKKLTDEKSGDALMNASNDVSEALRRTIGLMQGELERSVLSSQLLDESSANLRSATAAHDTLSTLLSTSKHLITALEKSDWLDRLLILASLTFFLLIVLFILKQRVLDKSVRIAFWWTRFLPNFSGDAKLLEVELGKAGTGVITATSTIVSTASSIFASSTAKQFSNPSEIVDSAISSLMLSETVMPTGDMHDLNDAIQDLLFTTDDPSIHVSVSQFNTGSPSNEVKRHEEL